MIHKIISVGLRYALSKDGKHSMTCGGGIQILKWLVWNLDLGVCYNMLLLGIEIYCMFLQETAIIHMDMAEDQDIINTSNVLDQSKDCHSVKASMRLKKEDWLAMMYDYTVTMVCCAYECAYIIFLAILCILYLKFIASMERLGWKKEKQPGKEDLNYACMEDGEL